MKESELRTQIPGEMLAAIEDITWDVLELRELMLCLAVRASNLPRTIPPSSPESVN